MIRSTCILFFCAILSACSAQSTHPGDDGPIAIVDVTIVRANENRLDPHQTILLEGDRIVSVGSADALDIPSEATIIRGRGRFAVAGLVDMHVHIEEADLPLYLDAGVTTVRNMWGFPDLKRIMSEIMAGNLDGPTIHSLSPGLDAAPAYWPYTQFVERPEDAEAVVRKQAEDGWTTLKLYADLRTDAFDAVIREAKRRNMGFGGHVPRPVGIEHALASGQQFIEHFSGYDVALGQNSRPGAYAWLDIDDSRIGPLISRTLAAGTWNCPTLAILDLITSGNEVARANRGTFLKALFDAGAPLLTGTDSGIEKTVPGRSLHDEMRLFEAAGLTPAEVLTIATTEAARFLDQSTEFGRIAPGLRADILLVDGNPLESLASLETPEVVFARGKRVH